MLLSPKVINLYSKCEYNVKERKKFLATFSSINSQLLYKTKTPVKMTANTGKLLSAFLLKRDINRLRMPKYSFNDTENDG